MLSASTVLAPLHLLVYGTLLGTQLYQSFVMTKISYQALPMSAFTTLQKKVFPAYFKAQSALTLLTIATFPPRGLVDLIHTKGELVSLALAGAFSVLNLRVYGPRTQKAMIARTHQETTDGKKYNALEVSKEMREKNRAFSKNHAMSIHLNLLSILATLWYGFALSGRLSFADR